MEKDKRALTSLRFLFAATFLGQMIVGAVGITVPIYAVLLGASPLVVGIVGAAGGLIYSFMPLAFGILSDRLRRKAFISMSMVSYGFSCIFYNLAEDPFMLAFIKVLEWISIAAFWPAIEALLADASEGRLEEALGKFNVSWGLAMVIGPMVGGLLISGYNIKAPFLLSLAISFSLGITSLIFVREPFGERETGTKENLKEEGSLNSQYSLFTSLSSILLFSSIGGVIQSLFPAHATDLNIPAYEIGLIMFIFGASRTVTFRQAYKIEAKLGKTGMFLVGSLTLAIASALTANSYAAVTFMIYFLIFGFGTGISYAASISFVLRRWGSSRGYAAGLFESLIGLGYFLRPLIGGIVSEYAPNIPYIFCCVLSLAVFFAQLTLNRRLKPSSLS